MIVFGIIAGTCLVVLCAFLFWMMLRIFVGFVTKYVASGCMVQLRSMEDLLERDLWYLPVSWISFSKENHGIYGRLRGTTISRYAGKNGSFGVTLYQSTKVQQAWKDEFSIFRLGGSPHCFEISENETISSLCQSYMDHHRSHAILVWQSGKMISETYAQGLSVKDTLPGWSMSKSVTNAMVGIATLKDGFDIHQPISTWVRGEFGDLTTHELLQMKSNIPWGENYFFYSDVTKMLYVEEDMQKFLTSKKVQSKGKKIWKYSSGDTNLIHCVLRAALGSKRYHELPFRDLFGPLGMDSARFETDATGLYVGSSYVYATARDWLRFGVLYAQNGMWMDKEILTPAWVDYSKTVCPESKGEYGAHFWCNQGRKMPDVPQSCYSAEGFMGQRVFVLPSHHAVVVRLGASKKDAFDFNGLLSSVLSRLEEKP
ncbi:MAG: serine hydrolase [Bdellovibrionota bacterium]